MRGMCGSGELCEQRKNQRCDRPWGAPLQFHPMALTENSDDSQGIFTGFAMGPGPRNQAYGGTISMQFTDVRYERSPTAATYCRASMRRVITRLRSLSERRNSSILLME